MHSQHACENRDSFLFAQPISRSDPWLNHPDSASSSTGNRIPDPNSLLRLPNHPRCALHFPSGRQCWYRPVKTTRAHGLWNADGPSWSSTPGSHRPNQIAFDSRNTPTSLFLSGLRGAFHGLRGGLEDRDKHAWYEDTGGIGGFIPPLIQRGKLRD